MPNYTGLLGQMGQDQFPDARKPAADIFTQFGIMTPSEKQQQAQQQQMIMQLYQQQQNNEQQRLAIQKSQLATGYGFPALTAMGGTRQQRPQQGMLGAGYQDKGADEPSRILQQSIAEAGGDDVKGAQLAGARMLQRAQATGDQDLVKIGTNLITKSKEMALAREKDQEEINSKRMGTSVAMAKEGRDAAQAGNPDRPYDARDAEGNLNTFENKKDSLGRVTGRKFLGGGPVKQTNANADEDYKALHKEFRTYAETKSSANSRIDKLTQGLADGAGQGWTANMVNFVNNVQGTVRQFAPKSEDYEPKALTLLDKLDSSTFKEWAKKTGVQTAIWRDLISIQAKSYNPTGTITEKDVRQAAESVGGNFSDPATVKAILANTRNMNIEDVQNKFDFLSPEAKELSKPQYDTFNSKYKKDGGAAGKSEATPKTKAEYEALPSGTVYVGPDGKKRRKK